MYIGYCGEVIVSYMYVGVCQTVSFFFFFKKWYVYVFLNLCVYAYVLVDGG